jgi:ABC-type nitrate/sulfonate/bicarbonate transport system ATPase subunit
VRDNVRFGLTLAANRHRQVPPARIEDMIGKVGLARFADALPAQLSRGMRRGGERSERRFDTVS